MSALWTRIGLSWVLVGVVGKTLLREISLAAQVSFISGSRSKFVLHRFLRIAAAFALFEFFSFLSSLYEGPLKMMSETASNAIALFVDRSSMRSSTSSLFRRLSLGKGFFSIHPQLSSTW